MPETISKELSLVSSHSSLGQSSPQTEMKDQENDVPTISSFRVFEPSELPIRVIPTVQKAMLAFQSIICIFDHKQLSMTAGDLLQALFPSFRVNVFWKSKSKSFLLDPHSGKSIAAEDSHGLVFKCFHEKQILLHDEKNSEELQYELNYKFDSIGGRLVSCICLPILDAMKNCVGVLQLLQTTEDENCLQLDKDQIAIIDTFSQYLGIAEINSRIHSESLTFVRKIRQIVRDVDFENALSNIITLICKILDCDRATLFMLDGSTLWIKAAKGLKDISFPASNSSIAGFVALGGVQLNIPDAYQDKRFNPSIDLKTGYRTRTILCTPVLDELGNCVAVMQAINKNKGAVFNRRDEYQLKVLGSIVSTVLRNISIYTVAKNSSFKLNALLQLTKALNSQSTLTSLIREMMVQAKNLVNSDKCTVFLLDTKTDELWSKMSEEDEEIRFPASAGIAGHVAKKVEMLNIPDAYKDSRFNRKIDIEMNYRTKSILCAPIVNQNGVSIGCIQAINKMTAERFDRQDEELIKAFGSQAAISIEASRAQSKLEELQKFFKSNQSHSSSNLMIELTSEGRITSVGPSELFETLSIVKEKVINRTYKYWLGEKNDDVVLRIERIFKNPHCVFLSAYQYVNDDGDIISMNINIVPETYTDLVNNVLISKVHIVFSNIIQQKQTMTTLGAFETAKTKTMIDFSLNGLPPLDEKDSVFVVCFRRTSGGFTHGEQLTEDLVKNIYSNKGYIHRITGECIFGVFGVPICTGLELTNILMASKSLNERETLIGEISGGVDTSEPGEGSAAELFLGVIRCDSQMESQHKLEMSYIVSNDMLEESLWISNIAEQFGRHILVEERAVENYRSRGKEENFSFRELGSFAYFPKDYQTSFNAENQEIVISPVGDSTKVIPVKNFLNYYRRRLFAVYYAVTSEYIRMEPVFNRGLNAFHQCKWKTAFVHFRQLLSGTNDNIIRFYMVKTKFFSEKRCFFNDEWKGLYANDIEEFLPLFLEAYGVEEVNQQEIFVVRRTTQMTTKRKGQDTTRLSFVGPRMVTGADGASSVETTTDGGTSAAQQRLSQASGPLLDHIQEDDIQSVVDASDGDGKDDLGGGRSTPAMSRRSVTEVFESRGADLMTRLSQHKRNAMTRLPSVHSMNESLMEG
eukprot:g3089.t1